MLRTHRERRPSVRLQQGTLQTTAVEFNLSWEPQSRRRQRKKDNYLRKEFNYQSFFRSFTLPEYIDENKIQANYKDGILHVEIAKKEGSKKKSSKTIAIQ